MRIVIQKVKEASVTVENEIISSIEKGLLILVGIEDDDTDDDIDYLVRKIVNLRVFDDENGVMNLSVKDVDGEIIVVSQFTLHASTKTRFFSTNVREIYSRNRKRVREKSRYRKIWCHDGRRPHQ